MICSQCGNVMQALGNVSGFVYTSNPPQWDEVYVCHACKIKTTKRVHGNLPPNFDFLKDYKDSK